MLFSIVLAGCVPGTAAHAGPGACAVLREPIAAGAFLTGEAVAETPCRDEKPRLPLRYDRGAGAPLALEALPAGTYLGPIVLKPGPIAVAGEPLRLVIRQGPVTITREVRPLQAVRSGGRAFVRTGDGEVFAARFVAAEEAR